jgi:pimeloyl-ACP methyl ester carboxylesterase
MRRLAETLPQRGVAVLRYDRRRSDTGSDIPLGVQADDAEAAAVLLRETVGAIPVGLWAWSQGCWAAAVVAARDQRVAFLIVVGSSGVSPAAQMRHGTTEQLLRAGFSERDVTELLRARCAYEEVLRGAGDPGEAQRLLDLVATRPWRHLAYMPDRLPRPHTWPDMDFDPAPTFAATRCPVLAVWGEDDPWVPVDQSESVWRRAVDARLTVLRLPAVGHGPAPDDERYEQAVASHILSSTAADGRDSGVP